MNYTVLLLLLFAFVLFSAKSAEAKPVKNKSLQYAIEETTGFSGKLMETILEKHSYYVRDTITTEKLQFDLPADSVGFYPIIPHLHYSILTYITVDSSAPVSLSFYKCGRSMSLGILQKETAVYYIPQVRDFANMDCGHERKNEFIKLVIGTGKIGASGTIRMSQQTPQALGYSIMLLCGVVIGVGLALVVFGILSFKTDNNNNKKPIHNPLVNHGINHGIFYCPKTVGKMNGRIGQRGKVFVKPDSNHYEQINDNYAMSQFV